MTQPLSPAAQAVRHAYGDCIGGVDAVMGSEWRGLAAALRALADQAGSAKHWHVNEIRTIAAELEGGR